MNQYLASLWRQDAPKPTIDPAALVARDVCSTCKRPLSGSARRCREHGAVIPMLIHVCNEETI